MSGPLFGALFWSFVVQSLLSKGGLLWTHWTIAGISLVVCGSACALLFFQDPPSELTDSPKSADEDARDNKESKGTDGQRAGSAGLRRGLRTTLLVVSVLCTSLGLSAVIVYLPGRGADHGIAPECAGYLLSCFYAAAVVSHGTAVAVNSRYVSAAMRAVEPLLTL